MEASRSLACQRICHFWTPSIVNRLFSSSPWTGTAKSGINCLMFSRVPGSRFPNPKTHGHTKLALKLRENRAKAQTEIRFTWSFSFQGGVTARSNEREMQSQRVDYTTFQ